MLFRFLLIVSVLLASVEGAPVNIRRHDSWPNHMAPINIRRHDSWPKQTIPAGNTNHLIFGPCSKTCGIGTRVVYKTRGCQNGQDKCFLRTEQCKGPEDCGLDGIVPTKISWNNKYIIYIAVSISIFLLGLLTGVICYSICRYLKKDKSKGKDESDEDYYRVTTDKPLGKHEDGPMVKERDVLENANISTPGPVDVVINIETDKDVAISSDRKHEEQTKIVTDIAPQGPMVEKREILNSTMIPVPDAIDEVVNMGPDEDAVTAPDRNHKAPRGPLAEKRDKLKNIKLPPGRVRDIVAKYTAYQNAIINSDRKHENKRNIGNYEAPCGPLAGKRDNLKTIEIPSRRVRDIVAKYKAYQNAIINSDKHQKDEKHIPPPRPVLRTTCEHCFVEFKARLSQNRQVLTCVHNKLMENE
ncbi:uncharacterized protein LOC143809128 isoform X3 [Ranitomeya variabilis]|uniref:uncharacterized protein LOC143809128 isoform X3 n=1 Tax=Ranitomeya variabilis TaxID=490064 RepID=UPI004057AD1E